MKGTYNGVAKIYRFQCEIVEFYKAHVHYCTPYKSCREAIYINTLSYIIISLIM
jgi:hypothetical protein